MANREVTYYSLLSSENLRHIEQMADTMDEQSFVTLGFEKKWFCHLWIGANNEAFLEYISHQTDLTKLDMILGEQLKLYARKKGEGYEQDKADFYGTYKARKDWLNHTLFICSNEYNKTQNEVFNEVVKWCVDWQNEWLETFNPYSPTERKELSKDLKTPLWEQLNEGEPPQQTEKPKPELTINQIALKYVYSDFQITRENGNEIAKQYGHNSGEKLFQRFTFYSSLANRKGKPHPCTPKKLKNKIELLESVIELLPVDKQSRAKDEVSILKNILEAEYL